MCQKEIIMRCGFVGCWREEGDQGDQNLSGFIV